MNATAAVISTAALLVASCAEDFDVLDHVFACADSSECADGYVCDPAEAVCVAVTSSACPDEVQGATGNPAGGCCNAKTCFVPAGTAWVVDAAGAPRATAVGGFLIDRYELSAYDVAAFDSEHRPTWNQGGGCTVSSDGEASYLPANCVSHTDAVAWCQRRGAGWTLPSMPQVIRALRGDAKQGVGSPTCTGVSVCCEVANVLGCQTCGCSGEPGFCPVGHTSEIHPAVCHAAGESPFGVRNLYGNVEEWISGTNGGWFCPASGGGGEGQPTAGLSYADAPDRGIECLTVRTSGSYEVGFRCARSL